VDPQRLVQCDVERGAVVSKLITQRLLGLSLIEMGRRRASGTLLLLGCATTASGAGRTVHDDEASMSCTGCSGITQPSSRNTNTSGAGAGADAGWLPHWPHTGVERRHRRHPPPPRGHPRQAQVLTMPTPPWSLPPWLLPQPPLPAVAPWPQPCRPTTHPSPPRLSPPAAPSTNAASSAWTLPT
jgi:hypothetical protein